MVGAIAFDPTIRGILVVLVATTVLIGSIYMLLATNSGVKVGFLIAASGLFGWMFLMGSIWVIYGIGLVGRAPSWMATDVNLSRDSEVPGIPELAKLPPDDELPNAEKILESEPLIHALALGSENKDYVPSTLTKLKTVIQPMVTISSANLAPIVEKARVEGAAVIEENPEVEALLDEGGEELRNEVRDQARQMRDDIEEPLGGWCLLTESDPRRGEAQSSADAALTEANAFGEQTLPANYIVKDVFFFGGKDPCEPIAEKPTIEQALHRVKTTLQVKNPRLLAAVTVVKVKDIPAVAGQAPPPATADPDASTVTVGMLRNLGNKRFIPFMFALANFIGFVIFTTMLHYRDKQAMEIRAAFGGAGKAKD